MPKFHFPHDLDPPEPPDVCELAIFPVGVVPFALGALEARTTAYTWSDDGYARGVQLIRSMQMAMLCGGMNELVESNNRLYRLMDTALNGRVYTVDSTEPLLITPAIADVPIALDPPAGMVANLDNLPGILDPGWFGYGGHKATIADIVRSLRVGNSNTSSSIVGQLEDILGAAGNVAQIGELVVDAFTGTVEAVEEGGIMVLLAAAIVGNLAATGALSAQLSTLGLQLLRISNSLDGGGLLPPADSVLEALRGSTAAGDDRNVIDELDAIKTELV